jgi:hypothetical protein
MLDKVSILPQPREKTRRRPEGGSVPAEGMGEFFNV